MDRIAYVFVLTVLFLLALSMLHPTSSTNLSLGSFQSPSASRSITSTSAPTSSVATISPISMLRFASFLPANMINSTNSTTVSTSALSTALSTSNFTTILNSTSLLITTSTTTTLNSTISNSSTLTYFNSTTLNQSLNTTTVGIMQNTTTIQNNSSVNTTTLTTSSSTTILPLNSSDLNSTLQSNITAPQTYVNLSNVTSVLPVNAQLNLSNTENISSTYQPKRFGDGYVYLSSIYTTYQQPSIGNIHADYSQFNYTATTYINITSVSNTPLFLDKGYFKAINRNPNLGSIKIYEWVNKTIIVNSSITVNVTVSSNNSTAIATQDEPSNQSNSTTINTTSTSSSSSTSSTINTTTSTLNTTTIPTTVNTTTLPTISTTTISTTIPSTIASTTILQENDITTTTHIVQKRMGVPELENESGWELLSSNALIIAPGINQFKIVGQIKANQVYDWSYQFSTSNATTPANALHFMDIKKYYANPSNITNKSESVKVGNTTINLYSIENYNLTQIKSELESINIDPTWTAPSNTVYVLNVSLYNHQPTTLYANEPVAITINSIAYNTYFNSKLTNYEIFNGISGNILYSWLESGNNNALAPNAVIWVSLPAQIAASTNAPNVISIGFLPMSVTAMNGNNVGEAPELSTTYGQYDDGANVFTHYTNFACASGGPCAAPSGWANVITNSITMTATTYGNVIINNGLTIVANTIGSTTTNNIKVGFTSNWAATGNVVDEYVSYANVIGSNAYAQLFISNTAAGPLWIGNSIDYINTITYGNTQVLNSIFNSVGAANVITGGNIIGNAVGKNVISFNVISVYASNVYGFNSATDSPSYYSNGNELLYPLEANTISSGNILGGSYLGLGANLTHGGTNTRNVVFTVNWIRMRLPTPGDIMPNTIIAPAATGVTNAIQLTLTNTLIDQGQSILFTAITSAGPGPYTYNFLILNSITNAVIVNQLYTSVASQSNTFFWTPPNALYTANTFSANVVVNGDPLTYEVPFGYNSALSIPTITPGSAITLDAGQSNTIATYETGGTSPYTYNFIVFNSISNTVLANQLGASNTFTFTTNALWATNSPLKTNVIVTDGATTENAVNSINSAQITVNPTLATPTITPSNTALDSGQHITFTSSAASGGTSPYTYNFQVYNSITSVLIANQLGTSATFTRQTNTLWTSNSPINANVFIEDSATTNMITNSVNTIGITINSMPTMIGPFASNAIIDSGQYVAFSVSETGGTGPLFNTQLFNVSNSFIQNGEGNVLITSIGGSNTFSAFKASSTTSSNAFVFAANYYDEGTTTPYLISANSVVNLITVGLQPEVVAISPAGNLAYVTNYASSSVNVINVATNTVINTIKTGTPYGLAFSPSGNLAYVANYFSPTVTINVINVATNTIIDTIGAGQDIQAIAFTPSGNLAYAASYAGSVNVINVATNALVNTILLGPSSNPDDVAFTPSGNLAYVVDNGGSAVNVINVATNTVINTITVGSQPTDVAFTPSGNLAYVTNYASGSVNVINVATNTVINTIKLGGEPQAVAFTPLGNLAYVTNYDSSSVNVINVATNTLIDTIVVGQDPESIAFTPTGNLAYVLGFSGAVSVIDTASIITVNPAMATPSITTPSPSTQLASNTLTWTASFTGGSSSYTYNWNVYNTITGTIISNMLETNSYTGNSFSWTPGVNYIGNTVNANVFVTDSASTPVTANSPYSGTITLVPSYTPPSTPICSAPTNALVDNGQYEQISCSGWTGGTSPYTVNQYVFNALSGNIVAFNSIASTSATSATFNFQTNAIMLTPNSPLVGNVVVTDSHPTTVNSIYSSAFTVDSALSTPSITISTGQLSSGNNELFTVSFSGGTTPYTYNYQIINTITNVAIANMLISNSYTSNTWLWQAPKVDVGNTVEANVIITDSATPNNIVNGYSSNIAIISPEVILPANIIAYIPITFTNNQNTAVQANTPLAIGYYTAANVYGTAFNYNGYTNVTGFNALPYQQYELPELNNTEFFFQNGTIVKSWLEGNYFNENWGNSLATSFTSHNALGNSANIIWWVLIQSPNFLVANSNNILYMGWRGNVITSANVAFNNTVSGEAPQLSCPNPYNTIVCDYGSSDTGNLVFDPNSLGLYDNFMGTTLSSQWNSITVGGTLSVDNGLTLTGGTANALIGINSIKTFNGITYTLDFYGDSFEPSYVWDNPGLGYDMGVGYSSSTMNVEAMSLQQSSNALILCPNQGTFDEFGGCSSYTVTRYFYNFGDFSTPPPPKRQSIYWTLTSLFGNETNGILMTNYSYEQSIQLNIGLATYNASMMSNQFAFASVRNPSEYINLQFIRLRKDPPNDVMPTTAVGPVQSAGRTLTLSNTFIDQGQGILFTASTLQEKVSPYSYNYSIIAYNSLLGQNVIIANMLITSNSYTSNSWFWQPSGNLYIGNSMFEANVIITDNYPTTLNSIYQSFGYNSALLIPTITPSSPITLDDGQSNTIASYESGGTGPFTYNFIVFNSVSNAIIANQLSTSNTFTFITNSLWASNSPLKANVIVTDTGVSIHVSANSINSAAITVASALTTPTLATTPSFPVSVIAGNTVLFTASFSGGVAPYTYDYYVENTITGSIVANYSITNSFTSNILNWNIPLQGGSNTFEANVVITDSSGVSTNSIYSQTLTVLPPPKMLISNAIIDVGQITVANTVTPFNNNINGEFAWVARNVVSATGAPISLTDNPINITISPSDNLAYALSSTDNIIDVLNIATNSQVATITTANIPTSMVITPSGTLGYAVETSGNEIGVENLVTNSEVSDISSGSFAGGLYPLAIALDPNGAYVYVTMLIPHITFRTYYDGGIGIINISSNSIVGSIDLGSPDTTTPPSIAVAANGSVAYVVDANNDQVDIVNLTVGYVISTIPLNNLDCPSQLVLNPQDTIAYITDSCSDNVDIVNLVTGTEQGTIPIGSPQAGITIDPSGTFAYVTETDNELAVIALNNDTIVNTLPLGTNPGGVAIIPTGRFGYAISSGSSTATLIRVPETTVQATALPTLTLDALTKNTISFDFNGVVYTNNTGSNTIYGNYVLYRALLESTSANTTSNTITVNPALSTPSITTPSPTTQAPGNIITWTTSFTGGSSSYTYNWNVYNTITGTIISNMLETNSYTGNSFSWTIPSNAVGNTVNANVFVTDSASTPVTANSPYSGTITLVPSYTPPSTPICSAPTNALVDNGQYEQISCSGWTGGTSPYTVNQYVFNALSGNIVAFNSIASTSATSATFNFQTNAIMLTPNSPLVGNVVVTDSHPTTVNSIYSSAFVVNSALVVSISPTSASLATGQSETWTATVTPGQPSYTYNWLLYNSLGFVTNALYKGNTVTTNAFSFTFLAQDTYHANVIVTDSATTPETANSVNSIITVQNTCSFSVNTATINFFGNSLYGGSFIPGTNTIGTINSISVTDTGGVPTYIFVEGSNWIYNSNSFQVSNTAWSSAQNSIWNPIASSTHTASSNVEVQLTPTITNTLIPVPGGTSNNIYFGVQIPSGEAVGSYVNTENIISSC